MKKLIEDLHFADTDEYKKKKQLYLDEIFNLYNQTQSELQKTHSYKDIVYYTNHLNKIQLISEKNNINISNRSLKLKKKIASIRQIEDDSVVNISDKDIQDIDDEIKNIDNPVLIDSINETHLKDIDGVSELVEPSADTHPMDTNTSEVKPPPFVRTAVV